MSYVVQWRTKSQEDLVNRIKSNLDSVKMNFFEIAAYLYEAQERLYYHGYPTIVEFAKENFGFKKTLTYDLIKMFKTFRSGYMYLPDQSVMHLSQTQLIALSSCHAGRNNLAAIIKPTDSVKDVKRAVKIFNSLSHSTRSIYKAKNLQEFFEEFPTEPINNKDDFWSEEKADTKADFSAQAEKESRTLFEIYSDFTDAELLRSYLEDTVSAICEAADLCILGGSFRNDVNSLMREAKILLERFIHESL